jgi:hypothetical protein
MLLAAMDRLLVQVLRLLRFEVDTSLESLETRISDVVVIPHILGTLDSI